MQFLFGFLILALLAAALLLRRRQKKTWLREERHEESGTWIDKRSGERGTYGSLDAEREAERNAITRQGRINDLALEIRNFAFDNAPGFHEKSDSDLKTFTAFARTTAANLFAAIEAVLSGQLPAQPNAPSDGPQVQTLKKRILDFAYEQFPRLLDLELDTIRQFDRYVGGVASEIMERIRG